jgi:hypothetical protein
MGKKTDKNNKKYFLCQSEPSQSYRSRSIVGTLFFKTKGDKHKKNKRYVHKLNSFVVHKINKRY